MRLHLDYETRSPVNISAGVYAYAENLHTQTILASWAIDDEPFSVWRILRGDPMPMRLGMALIDPDTKIVAHNAAFERVISIIVGLRQGYFPREVWEAIRDPMRWTCTAARAAACGLPRALEKVALALNLDHQKDMEGHRLMMEMCSPRGLDTNGNYIWLEDEPRMVRLGQYCIGDGLAERDADKELPDLSPFEQEVYATTERMNDRGVLVDTKLLMALIGLVRDATNYLNHRINQLTNGQVPKITNPAAIVKWLKNYNLDLEDDGIGKWVIQGLLEDEALPGIVREVLVLRRDGGKSSTAKFNAILQRLNLDSRVRGALLYAGAAATSRWSSRGVQLQNLARIKTLKKTIKAAIDAVLNKETGIYEIEAEFGPPMVVASELVRPIFIAPEDYWLARGDYSQIETRVTAWLAGETRLLDAFVAYDAGTGPDLYIVTAADVCRLPQSAIDDNKRQTGKVTILACSFGGGVGALFSMARIYNIKISQEDAQAAVDAFRDANPNIKSFWYELDRAAIACMKDDPGKIHQVRGGIWFRRNDAVLTMHLPSGRHLIYWYPRLEEKEMPWGPKECVTYYAEDSQTHKWKRHTAWHGLWCENAVQATARDIMAHALVNLEKKNMRPVLTVHDEAVCQLSKSLFPTKEEAANAVKAVMLNLPEWASSLPLQAEASADSRYVKV